MKTENEKLPCYACQGGGCPVCSGFGFIENPVKYYSEKDLVEFGKYLLSNQREERIKSIDSENYEERKLEVYHADLANWIDLNVSE